MCKYQAAPLPPTRHHPLKQLQLGGSKEPGLLGDASAHLWAALCSVRRGLRLCSWGAGAGGPGSSLFGSTQKTIVLDELIPTPKLQLPQVG